MSPGDIDNSPTDDSDGHPSVGCPACDAALQSSGSDTVSFLLVDHLTIPVVGCAEHLARFGSACGFTTEASPELLEHFPAGGVPCPGCRHERYNSQHSLIPVEDGALAVLACPKHLSAILDRYRTGRQTRQQLSTTLDTA